MRIGFLDLRYIFFITLVVMLSSCITTRNLEYMGFNEEITQEEIPLQEYRLQAGDLLSIQISTTTEQQHDFFNKENTSNSQLMVQNPYLYGYMINQQGELDLPTFGIIRATGFTVSELSNIIQNIAQSYFESPVVKINIINFEVTILGEVNNPGTFQVVNPDINILQALSLSGDITKFGNRSKIKIIRNRDKINSIFYIDLNSVDILNDGRFMLQPNDIIYVSPLRKKFYAFDSFTNIISISLSALTLFLLINQK